MCLDWDGGCKVCVILSGHLVCSKNRHYQWFNCQVPIPACVPTKPPVAITSLHTDTTMNNSLIQNSPLRIIPAVAYCCSQLKPNCKFISEHVWLMWLRKYIFLHLKQMAQEQQTMTIFTDVSCLLFWDTYIFSEISGSWSGTRGSCFLPVGPRSAVWTRC